MSTTEPPNTRAQFSDVSSPNFSSHTESSPLLTSTPPTVSRVVVKAYPYLIIINKLLSILTWATDDAWLSMLTVLTYITVVVYFDTLMTYFGHLLVVATFALYATLNTYVESEIRSKPTLDDTVHTLSLVATKSEMLLSPITLLSTYDIKRLLFTTVFLTPLYVILAVFIFSPQKILLLLGCFLLTYHSSWSIVTRRLLWKFRFVRLLAFYLTGLDLGGINVNKSRGIFAAVKKVKSAALDSNGDGKPIRFTYVLFENQRRWLGIGWTSNMLSYERTAWTDEFLNESPAPENFRLPEESAGMYWRWVDKSWRLDLSNDGAIALNSHQQKTTANPGQDDAYIYYDNTWKKPSAEDTFSRYTRRRRWIRTAELVRSDGEVEQQPETLSPVQDQEQEKRRSLRFEESSTRRRVSFHEPSQVVTGDDE